jgi:hypothetical protein
MILESGLIPYPGTYLLDMQGAHTSPGRRSTRLLNNNLEPPHVSARSARSQGPLHQPSRPRAQNSKVFQKIVPSFAFWTLSLRMHRQQKVWMSSPETLLTYQQYGMVLISLLAKCYITGLLLPSKLSVIGNNSPCAAFSINITTT